MSSVCHPVTLSGSGALDHHHFQNSWKVWNHMKMWPHYSQYVNFVKLLKRFHYLKELTSDRWVSEQPFEMDITNHLNERREHKVASARVVGYPNVHSQNHFRLNVVCGKASEQTITPVTSSLWPTIGILLWLDVLHRSVIIEQRVLEKMRWLRSSEIEYIDFFFRLYRRWFFSRTLRNGAD